MQFTIQPLSTGRKREKPEDEASLGFGRIYSFFAPLFT